MWPRQHKNCANCGCGPKRRSYGSRGYCGRCFYLVKHIERAKKWDLERLDTHRRAAIKRLIRQANSRLQYLRLREDKRCGNLPVDPSDIENKFATIFHKLQRPGIALSFSQVASYIGKHLKKEERRALYILLDDIEEPWRELIFRWNAGWHDGVC